MSHDDFERELMRRLQSIEMPEESKARLDDAIGRLTQPPQKEAPTRRRLRRRRIFILAVAIVLAVGAASAVALRLAINDDGLTVPARHVADAALSESAVLSRAPWLRQSSGSPRIQTEAPAASLRYPRGTTYAQALRSLFVSVVEDGRLPARARLADPLPRGVVWKTDQGRGPRLSMTAPWGYTVPGGRIRSPAYSVSGSLSPAKASALFETLKSGRLGAGRGATAGVILETPQLLACQRQQRAVPGPECVLVRVGSPGD